ncbi:MAG: endonuclease III [Spirochaetaceae bacterium]|nr:endonuclease III [Spirochaetaceae bacterium]
MEPEASSDFDFLSESEIIQLFDTFQKLNPEPKSELEAPTPFTLLVSVVLSAQATDKSVNKATKSLYEKFDSPQKILELGEEGLIKYIKSIGLYRSKAKHIISLCKMLLSDFNGEIPSTREELMKLPGVGRKTANVVLNVIFGQPTMPVDTHLLRISPRLGLSNSKTPESVENDLINKIPYKYMKHAHHWMILHGRYICTARNPLCKTCPVDNICKHNFVEK